MTSGEVMSDKVDTSFLPASAFLGSYCIISGEDLRTAILTKSVTIVGMADA